MPHKPTSPHTPAPPPTRGSALSWGRRRGEREELVVGMRRPGAHAPGSMMPPLRGFRNRLSIFNAQLDLIRIGAQLGCIHRLGSGGEGVEPAGDLGPEPVG